MWLVAADAALDFDTLQPLGAGEALVKQLVLSEEQVNVLLAEGRAVTLTDQYAPVEQMLAPVFRGETAAK